MRGPAFLAAPNGPHPEGGAQGAGRVREITMPKMKTNKGAAKRFKVTGSGRVRRSKCGHSHGMISKNRKRNRRLRKRAIVHDQFEKRIRMLLPYA
jgi:large subunit ribosomal protein L35